MHPLIEALTATDTAAEGDSNDTEIDALQDARDTLIQYLPEPLRTAAVNRHRDTADEHRQAGYAVSLNAESVRVEVHESGNYSVADVQYVEALSDSTVGDAIRESLGDTFWYQFDCARSDAIDRLLAARDHARGETR